MNDAKGTVGKARIGWLCSYVPEELILAAGMEPVRIRGQAEGVTQADSYMFPNFCPYLKNLLESGLRGDYKEVEGIIFTSSCDGMRRLYDLWRDHVGTPFAHMLEVPKNRDEHAIRFFSEQLRELVTRLEKFFAVETTDDKLGESIGLVNKHRRLITALFERQKETPALYKGSELLALCLDVLTFPKQAVTGRLREGLTQEGTRNSTLDNSPRVGVVGNVVDRPDLFKLVEAAGASIVAFDTCPGMRHWTGLVDGEQDPIESLARRYLCKPPCPRMPGFDQRIAQIAELVQDYSIDGIIYSNMKFCDYGLFEAPVVERTLRNPQLPFLVLENEYVWGDTARIRTRIEAFVEMMKGDLD